MDQTFQTTGQGVPQTYPAPTVVGGATPVSVVCTPSSGSVFPLGKSPVTCVAADSQNRSDRCSFMVTVQTVPMLTATRFVAFGDSITEGALASCPGTSSLGYFNLQDDLKFLKASVNVPTSYPTKLQTLLRNRYSTQQPTVLNEGVGGETVEGGVARLPGVLDVDAPHALLLQEGVNNLSGGGSASAVVNGLRTMIRQARGRGIPVLLGTLLPEREGACRAYTPAAIAPTNDQIRVMAAAEGAVIVDLYQVFNGMTGTLLGPDGLHPNESGYQAIAQTYFDTIRERLEGSPIQR